MALVFASMVFAQVGGLALLDGPTPVPTTRPSECRASPLGNLSIWEQVRFPGLARYCNLLSTGYSRLDERPSEALELGQKAQRLISSRAAPFLLMAQAERRRQRFDKALAYFHGALQIDPRAIHHPGALRDLAITELRLGRLDEAARSYRALIQAASSIPRLFERQRIFVEAALSLMATGPDGLAEALGYLSELRSGTPLPVIRPYLLATLALALSRADRDDEARALSAEASGPWVLEDRFEAEFWSESERPPVDVVLVVPKPEAHALVAISSVGHDPELFVEHFQAYLAQKNLPEAWRAHAQRELRAAGKKPYAPWTRAR